jgi:hypothetical protein
MLDLPFHVFDFPHVTTIMCINKKLIRPPTQTASSRRYHIPHTLPSRLTRVGPSKIYFLGGKKNKVLRVEKQILGKNWQRSEPSGII